MSELSEQTEAHEPEVVKSLNSGSDLLNYRFAEILRSIFRKLCLLISPVNNVNSCNSKYLVGECHSNSFLHKHQFLSTSGLTKLNGENWISQHLP